MPTNRALRPQRAAVCAMLAAVALATALLVLPALAHADDAQTTASVGAAAQSAAMGSEAAPAVAQAPAGVDLPDLARDGISVDTEHGSLKMRLPATGRADETDGARVFDGSGNDSLVVVQPVADGARAMIQIGSPDAPAHTGSRSPVPRASSSRPMAPSKSTIRRT